jgi:RHS repeat-associated protein
MAAYSYDSFGNSVASTGGLNNPFRYTAREFDFETGLNYYRMRFYSADSGRFLAEDPVRFTPKYNFYTYVGNGPINFVDPWGLCRIIFNGEQIYIETNDGSQKLGPFPASNKTVCNCGINEGVYFFDPGEVQWMVNDDGTPTPRGKTIFREGPRTRREAFGDARIPLKVPGRLGIMIHARFPDTPDLKPTEGCVRVHNAVTRSMAKFVQAVCASDGIDSLHFFRRKW